MSSRLTFAIPSKGRLKEQTEAFLATCGWTVRSLDGERGYRAALDGGPEVDLILLSAREIAERLIAGTLHVGVTGEDLLHELAIDVTRQVHKVKRLGFGGARVVVAVPASWVDVTTLADLEAAGRQFRERHGRRLILATKYPSITRAHFAEAGVTEYRIIDSAGATEAAPAAGTADLIVDITTTGATLRANHLKELSDGMMLDSEATLTASLGADWSDAALAAMHAMLDTVAARKEPSARVRLDLTTALPMGHDAEALFGLEPVTGSDLRLSWLVGRERSAEAARVLAALEFGPVRVSSAQFVFHQSHTLSSDFRTALSNVTKS